MRVIGVGDCVVDVYLHVDTYFPGGNALNVAVYAAQLGHEAAFMGIMGNDEFGEHILSVLARRAVDTSHCRVLEGQTGFAMVDLVDGDRVFVGSNGGGVSGAQTFSISDEDKAYLSRFDLMHTSCYSMIEPQLPTMAGLPPTLSFDFSDKLSSEYLDRVCPHVDIGFFSCGHLTKSETRDLLTTAFGRGCPVAVGTRGAEGAIARTAGGFAEQPAYVVDPVDTLGAGDSFITQFLLSTLSRPNSEQGKEVIEESMNQAAKFAAQTCGTKGAFGDGRRITDRSVFEQAISRRQI